MDLWQRRHVEKLPCITVKASSTVAENVTSQLRTSKVLDILRSFSHSSRLLLFRMFSEDAVASSALIQSSAKMTSIDRDDCLHAPSTISPALPNSFVALNQSSRHGLFKCRVSSAISSSTRLKMNAFDLRRSIVAVSSWIVHPEGSKVTVCNAVPLLSEASIDLKETLTSSPRRERSMLLSSSSGQRSGSPSPDVKLLEKRHLPVLSSTNASFDPVRLELHPSSDAKCAILAWSV